MSLLWVEMHDACEAIRRDRDRIRSIADRGAFAHPDSLEATLIRKAAKEILADLARLEANTPADLIKERAA